MASGMPVWGQGRSAAALVEAGSSVGMAQVWELSCGCDGEETSGLSEARKGSMPWACHHPLSEGAGGLCGTQPRPVRVVSQRSDRDVLGLLHCLQSSLSFCSVPSHLTQLHPQHQRILTQRQHVSPKKLWSPKADPCAGLMTCKEKDWVVKVEMIQLQSENLDDDYYYQTYYHRLEHKQAEEELLGGRNKQEPPKLVTPFIQKVETYNSVVRIAGSLGQVAVSTCYSPRRAIDAVHHALVEEVGEGGHQAPSFLPCLSGFVPVRAFIPREAEDEFLQVLCVRKGKKLTARLLPHLAPEQAEKILLTITHHLPFLMKKDVPDEVSTSSLGQRVLGCFLLTLFLEQAILLGLSKAGTLPESAELPLTMALKNQFGISLLYSLLSRGEGLLSSETPLEPHIGDFETWTDTVFLVARELSQVPKALLVEPLFLPSNLLSLFCRYLDKQTVHHLEAKMESELAWI
uniref:PAT1 homolog 2 n=1 Tax=Phasianus colchicus TaxID=9054 RepID=A0A669NYS1_PHACC